MTTVCEYAKKCSIYKELCRNATGVEALICRDPLRAPLCRRARYQAVYGDDAPHFMPAQTGRPAGRVWLRA